MPNTQQYRDRAVTVLMYDSEYEKVREAAFRARKSVSAFLRAAAAREIARQERRKKAAS